MGSPNLVESTKLKIDVVSQGPSQGRTFQSENGREVQVITDVNKQAFFKYITDLAKKIESKFYLLIKGASTSTYCKLFVHKSLQRCYNKIYVRRMNK